MSVLKHKKVLITGATGGVGEALAQTFASLNCSIFLTGTNKKKLQLLAKKIGPRCQGYEVADFKNTESIENLLKIAKRQLKNVDILINCAGVFPVKFAKDTTFEEYNDCFNVNVTAPFLLCRSVIPDMIDRRWGRIINIGSSSAYAGFAKTSVYCASKHALLGLSRALHAELKEYGVRVHSVSPGSVKTKMGEKVEGQDYETFIDPDELASFIAHIISYDKNMISEEIRLNRVFVQ